MWGLTALQSPAALNCDGDGVSRAERESDNDTVSKAWHQLRSPFTPKRYSEIQHAAARIVSMPAHNITMFPLQTVLRSHAGACNTKSKNCSSIYLAVFIETTCFQGNSLQSKVLALSLFVLRVLTDNSDCALSLDDLTFFANRFYGRSNFHVFSLLSKKVRLSL